MAVLTANTKRETGKKAQSGNIMAAKVNLAARANFLRQGHAGRAAGKADH
jgi:hypothetical protein